MSCGRLAVRGADCQVARRREEAAMGFEIVRLDHVQLAMPPGGEEAARGLLRGPARARTGPQAGAPGGPGRLLVPPGRHGGAPGRGGGLPPGPQGAPGLLGPRPARPSRPRSARQGWRCGPTPTGSRDAVPTSTTRSGTASSSLPRTEAAARGPEGIVKAEDRGGAGGDGADPPPVHRWRAPVLGRHQPSPRPRTPPERFPTSVRPPPERRVGTQ